MTIWNSKGTLIALALTALIGCDAGQGGVLSGLPSTGAGALPQASMGFGAVNLTAPAGYCIDKRSLKQRFALLARCDVLGSDQGPGNPPLSVITVSLAPMGSAVDLPSPEQTAAAHGLTDVSGVARSQARVTFRADGPPIAKGMSKRHWRGTARVGGQVMALALYAPQGQDIPELQARNILAAMMDAARPAP